MLENKKALRMKPLLGRIVSRIAQLQRDYSLIDEIERREGHPASNNRENVHDEEEQGDNLQHAQVEEESPDVLLSRKELRALIDEKLDTLTPEQAKILHLRFDSGLTYDQIGPLIGKGKTGERIRQIEWKAIRKMRHSSRADDLRPFAENNPTSIPERLWIKIADADIYRQREVSRDEFETIVMKMFDDKVGTEKEIAKKLDCKPLFVVYALKKKLYERNLALKEKSSENRHPVSNPDKITP